MQKLKKFSKYQVDLKNNNIFMQHRIHVVIIVRRKLNVKIFERNKSSSTHIWAIFFHTLYTTRRTTEKSPTRETFFSADFRFWIFCIIFKFVWELKKRQLHKTIPLDFVSDSLYFFQQFFGIMKNHLKLNRRRITLTQFWLTPCVVRTYFFQDPRKGKTTEKVCELRKKLLLKNQIS